jgi:hypothetical protein
MEGLQPKRCHNGKELIGVRTCHSTQIFAGAGSINLPKSNCLERRESIRKWGRWNEKFAEKSNRKQKIAVGSRAQNAFIERFNRTYWEEILDAYWFLSSQQVRDSTQEWILTYDQQRPHDALSGLSPIAFLRASPSTMRRKMNGPNTGFHRI